MDYKETLLMPKTEFPMRGNLPNKESKFVANNGKKRNCTKRCKNARKEDRCSSCMTDHLTPTATCTSGMRLNQILKDFIVRYKSMSGYHAPYVPGWDTHGLPIETALIKKENIDRKNFSVSEFREKCAQYALEQVERQKEQRKSFGSLGDWENPYLTLTKEYEAAQIKVFGEMAKKGYIYKGYKPVYWSPSSESALAEAEIEYKDKRSPSIYVAYEVIDGKGVLENGTKIVIWTTTPWTIPASLGITLHPDLQYDVVKVDADRFVVAHDLVEQIAEKLEWENYDVLKTFMGREAERIVAKHPFYDRDILVMLGTHVTTESGTGCVHTAPGHGEEDFYVSKQYGIEAFCPVDEQGKFTDEAPGFEGLFYEDANKVVTEKLKEAVSFACILHSLRTRIHTIGARNNRRFSERRHSGLRPSKTSAMNILKEIRNVQWYPALGRNADL